jgi:EAL domain-containing protein (putative c-di-GMP-specific phosphodiesterase class I)
MLDVVKAIQTLKDLQALGVNLAIDDFGTGYASLNYLTRFPIHALKIDRSFVQGVSKQSNDTKVTSAIVALGKNLGLRVIAEGAETMTQVQYLRELGCDEVQGYFFSAAVTAKEFEAMIRGNTKYSLNSVQLANCRGGNE